MVVEKRVFVTVGTTRFDQLLETVVGGETKEMQSVLKAKGFTQLIIQSGKSLINRTELSEAKLKVEQYEYKPSLEDDISSADLVISHAGAGTCLEVLEARKPLIVVVNEHLMDNHQVELAEKLGEAGHLEFCVCSTLIDTIENFDASKLKPFPPGDLNAFSSFIDSLFPDKSENNCDVASKSKPLAPNIPTCIESEREEANYLRGSITSTFINILLSVSFGIITWSLNAFILRQVSKEVLGTINSRLCLLSSTILFFARESFRRACQKKPKDEEWKGVIKLLWLQIPLGVILAFILGAIWLDPNMLDVPEEDNMAVQYQKAVYLVCIGSVLELCGEPFWVISQVYMYIKFRAAVDFFYTLTRAVIMATAVHMNPELAILVWGWSTVFVSLGIPVINIIFYHRKLTDQNLRIKKEDLKREPNEINTMPFTSIKDILPDWKLASKLDSERFYLMLGFFKQGLLKQILTEGEAYMFTFFNLMSLAEQGVYNIASQFGSLAGRLIFSKVEEAAYFYFSQTVTRGPITDEHSKEKGMEEKASKHLYKLLRAMLLIGLVVATFAQSYSHMLLHIYGGEKLSSGIGPELLRWQSIFLLFMAVNGVSECYSFASMTTPQVECYKYLMFVMTCVFLLCVYLFAKLYGPLGFVLANCCNFTMRIIHNFYHIYQRHRNQKEKPWKLLSSGDSSTVIILVVCGSVCKISELLAYNEFSTYQGALCHLMIGVVCFLITVFFVVSKEEFLKQPVLNWLKKFNVA